MNQKRIPIILISAGLLVVCGLCALTVYGTYAWFGTQQANIRFFTSMDTSATVTENEAHAAKPTLILDSDNGNITILPGEGETFEVEMAKVGWGADQAEAEAAAQDIQVTIEETSEAVKITYRAPDEIGVMMNRGGDNHVDFTIHVPPATALEIKTNFGDVSVDGVEQSVQIMSQFGDILAKDVQAGENPVHLETSFGDITLDNIQGDELYIGTSNGSIQATNLSATGAIEVEDEFSGEIHLEAFEASKLTLTSQSGDVEVLDGTLTADITISNSFGDIRVQNIKASSYILDSENGTVRLDGASGAVQITNSFGDIEINNGKQVTLDVTSESGDLTFTGSLNPESSHQLKNSFGDITLTLPEDSAFDLSLETSFGEIKSDLPVTLTGALEDTAWQAEINGGGSLVTATTENGNIALHILATDE
ncbi:MAG TPA: DUF4097 family beta strand repeat-containing protein [Anaerolineales bacterium]|nr:DUF4097 family beta strand repeat-containing protein [Anaerolineales bacterium]